ncbi:MAG TPA: hypothetical protein VMS17_05915 [Gemmataceae bacterium]|nr:hypothetical protein [Gemmataceae bacterium]
MIRIQCPGCSKKLGIPDTMAGRVAACPQCNHRFRVPAPKDPQPEAEADEDRVAASPRPAPPAKKRRPPQEEEEGIVKAPRRRAKDEDDEGDEPPRRRPEPEDVDEDAPRPKRRKKKRRRKQAAMFGGLSPLIIGAIAVVGVCLLLGVVSFFVPFLALVPLAVGGTLSAVGGVWFLIVAFQDDATAGLLCIFVPFYSLYYLISHWDEEMKPFLVQLAGSMIFSLGWCAGGPVFFFPTPTGIRPRVHAVWQAEKSPLAR